MSAVAETLPRERVGIAEGLSHALTIARRNLLHIKADPEQIVGMTIQPLMFLVLFVFVFGGAIAGSSRRYLQFALPGIMVQGIAFTGFMTALGINNDFSRGVIDRFRSLPIARSAVVGGRIAADAVRVVWGVLIMAVFGLMLGFRFEGGFAGGLGALLLAAAFGVTVCWPMAFVGVIAKSPEAVNTWAFMMILPLTFASSTFAPASSMPGWLQAFVKVNPITHVVDATRGLMLGGAVGAPLWKAVVWLAAITLVFAPLAVIRYRKRI
jgi:ABC-2 type transport system permease protein/oleandomycin transport system permease protein